MLTSDVDVSGGAIVHTASLVSGLGSDPCLGLWYFQTDPPSIRASIRAGVRTFIVDWENRGKMLRQAERDTEVNQDTPDHLRAAAAIPGAEVVCRINSFDATTPQEVDAAVAGGASLILLPMVRKTAEAEAFLKCLDGRVPGGILIETRDAVAAVRELATLPLAAVYIGLNDLSIDYGTPHLFTALTDGVVEKIAVELSRGEVPFGFAGVTLVDAGRPIPCRLLMAELARLRASFSFMRRSFRRDVVGRDEALEVRRIQDLWTALKARDVAAVERDRAALVQAISGWQPPVS